MTRRAEPSAGRRTSAASDRPALPPPSTTTGPVGQVRPARRARRQPVVPTGPPAASRGPVGHVGDGAHPGRLAPGHGRKQPSAAGGHHHVGHAQRGHQVGVDLVARARSTPARSTWPISQPRNWSSTSSVAPASAACRPAGARGRPAPPGGRVRRPGGPPPSRPARPRPPAPAGHPGAAAGRPRRRGRWPGWPRRPPPGPGRCCRCSGTGRCRAGRRRAGPGPAWRAGRGRPAACGPWRRSRPRPSARTCSATSGSSRPR